MTVRRVPQLGVGYARPDSAIEAQFQRELRVFKVPAWKRNYRAIEGRKFEIDFAWPDDLIYIEIDGHAHRTREHFDVDREKSTLLTLAGWTGLHLTGAHVRSGRAIEWTRRLLSIRGVFPYLNDASKAPPHTMPREAAPGLSDDADNASEKAYT